MHVRIYQPAKSAMQSGRAKTKQWKIQFEPSEMEDRFIDPLMGWVGQKDTTQQLSLSFPTEEEAIAYAEQKGYTYRVVEPKSRTIKPKSYADNFAYDRITT